MVYVEANKDTLHLDKSFTVTVYQLYLEHFSMP